MVNRFLFRNGILFFSLVHISTHLGLTSIRRQLLRRGYLVNNFQLDPWFVSGFTDGDGCFRISITENKNYKLGWKIQPHFQLAQHERDKTVIKLIQKLFSVGKIYKAGPQTLQLQVQSIKELKIIIDHFDKYPLITQKLADYKQFKYAYSIVKKKEHLTNEGLRKIVAIKASMNWGLSENLKLAFPDVVPSLRTVRPLVLDKKIQHPNWLAGFTSAEGYFYVKITANKTYSVGYKVNLVFEICQHERDEQLIISLIDFFKCGNIQKNRDAFYYRVLKFDDIANKIIPFFTRYPIQGVKALDFAD